MGQKLSPELLDGCKNWMIHLSKAEIVIEHTEYETMIRTAKIDGKKTYDSVLYFSVSYWSNNFREEILAKYQCEISSSFICRSGIVFTN